LNLARVRGRLENHRMRNRIPIAVWFSQRISHAPYTRRRGMDFIRGRGVSVSDGGRRVPPPDTRAAHRALCSCGLQLMEIVRNALQRRPSASVTQTNICGGPTWVKGSIRTPWAFAVRAERQGVGPKASNTPASAPGRGVETIRPPIRDDDCAVLFRVRGPRDALSGP